MAGEIGKDVARRFVRIRAFCEHAEFFRYVDPVMAEQAVIGAAEYMAAEERLAVAKINALPCECMASVEIHYPTKPEEAPSKDGWEESRGVTEAFLAYGGDPSNTKKED
jgi:hypothetical protein